MPSKGKDPDVNTALGDWIGTVTCRGQKLSGLLLKKKAEDLAKKLGNPSFVATEGGLSQWKARHQIRCKQAHGEKGSADTQSAGEWISSVLP